MSQVLDRLKELTDALATNAMKRSSNLQRLKELFIELELANKVTSFEALFDFKAMNLAGISLKPEMLGAVQAGKYVQILAIAAKEKPKAKAQNRSLVYLGKAEKLTHQQKNAVVEFVLRWRYEKSMMTVNHYETLLDRLPQEHRNA